MVGLFSDIRLVVLIFVVVLVVVLLLRLVLVLARSWQISSACSHH